MDHSVEHVTAYHEAGHAALALHLGRPILRVTIHPTERFLGQCQLKKGAFRPQKDAVENEIIILWGGLAAEARWTGSYNWSGAIHDVRQIRRLTLERTATPAQMERLERRLLDKAEYLLDQRGVWPAVEDLAHELVSKTTISGRAAAHLFEQARHRAQAW